MRSYPELVLQGEGGTGSRAVAIGTRHLALGRGPDNDLVVPSPQVSRHHAIVWASEDQVMLRDLGSANGTFLDGERVTDTVVVPYGAEIRLGPDVRLSVRPPAQPNVQGELKAYALEDLATGMRQPLHSDRFTIGSGAEVDLRIEHGPADPVTLLVYPGGEVWLGSDEEETLLELETDFQVGDSRFRVVEVDPSRQQTVQPDNHRYPYRLRVDLNSPTGPVAVVSHIATSATHQVSAENRVVLLYLLARKIVDDRAQGVPAAEQGWCTDEDVIVGVWGRGALGSGSNRLKVLVHRVRKELRSSGFDAWCIEKRSGLIRGRFVEVEAE